MSTSIETITEPAPVESIAEPAPAILSTQGSNSELVVINALPQYEDERVNEYLPTYTDLLNGGNMKDPAIQKTMLRTCCLFFTTMDLVVSAFLYFYSILQIFQSNLNIFITTLPFFYTLTALMGRIGFTNSYTYIVAVYIILYFVRLLMDMIAVSKLSMEDRMESMLISTSQFTLALFQIGIRPFYTLLFPCAEQVYFHTFSYCADVMTYNGQVVNTLSIYVLIIIFQFCIGIMFVMQLKVIIERRCGAWNESIDIQMAALPIS